MKSSLAEFFKNTVESVSPDGFFAITSALILCGFIAAVVVAVKTNASRSVCVVFSLLCASIITVFSAIILVAEVPVQVFAFYFAVFAALSSVSAIVLSLVASKSKDAREEKELVRYIDGKIKDQAISSPPTIKCERNFDEEASEKQDYPKDGLIDFTHVKNVISRLNVYDVSLAERRQIEELKEVLYSAEKEGVTKKTKEKINDGLSFLLKIMSKYGV